MASDWNRIREHRWGGEYCGRPACFPDVDEDQDTVDTDFIVYADSQDDQGHRPDEDDPSAPACHVGRGEEPEGSEEDPEETGGDQEEGGADDGADAGDEDDEE